MLKEKISEIFIKIWHFQSLKKNANDDVVCKTATILLLRHCVIPVAYYITQIAGNSTAYSTVC